MPGERDETYSTLQVRSAVVLDEIDDGACERGGLFQEACRRRNGANLSKRQRVPTANVGRPGRAPGANRPQPAR